MILNRLGEPERCPSCKVRLDNRNYDAAHRLGENESCAPKPLCQRFNHHLVLPLLLLPVILLLLGIARLVARPEHESLLYKSSVEALNGQHNLEEFEDRDLISGIKTSFVPLLTNAMPLNVLPLSHQTWRRRRQIREVVYGLHDMENISSYDTIEWAAVKPPIKEKGGDNKEDNEGVEGYDTNSRPEIFQDDEQETRLAKQEILIEERRKTWQNFWYSKNDEESIRKTQAQMMLTIMNSSIDPCEDFYEYACGRWVNAHPIPKNRAGTDTFEILRSNIDAVVRRLLENDSDADENLENPDEGNERNKLSDIMSAREITSHEETDVSFPIKSPNKIPPVVPSAKHLEMKRNNEKALLPEMTSEKSTSSRTLDKNEVAHNPLLILSDIYRTPTSSEEVNGGFASEDFIPIEEDLANAVKSNDTSVDPEQPSSMSIGQNASRKERVKNSTHFLAAGSDLDTTMHSNERPLTSKGVVESDALEQHRKDRQMLPPTIFSSTNKTNSHKSETISVRSERFLNDSDTSHVPIKNDTVYINVYPKERSIASEDRKKSGFEKRDVMESSTAEQLSETGWGHSGEKKVVSFNDTKNVRLKLVSRPFTVVDLEQTNRSSQYLQAENRSHQREGRSVREVNVNGVLPEMKTKQQNRPNDAIRKARNLYKSCMNVEILQKRSEKPLVKLLEELGGGWPEQNEMSTLFEWTSLAAKLRLYNNNIFIAEWVGPDIRNSSEFVVQLDEAGLGLPTRDYFLSTSSTEALKAYRQFIVTIANLLGATVKEAEKLSEQLVNFEIHLALITATHEEKKNLSELYHKMTVDELCESVPGINWREYLGTLLESTHPNFDMSSLNSTTVVVFALRYFRDLAGLLEKYPPRIIQSYILWRFASHRAGNLDLRFLAAISQLRRILTGREEEPPRWEACVAHTTAALGHAVGSLFVKQYFDEQSKSDTLRMTTEIRSAFRQSIMDPNGATATWMDKETRSLAVDKADAMALRVGYPDSILDPDLLDLRYADLKIDPELYFENTLAILRYLTWREHSFLGMPVDKAQWSASPTEVNAFYSRNKNQILLPAGILQPPFYHRHFPRSLNYGGVGVVIGHEMTHGFDIRGRLFDRNGNLQRWWQPPSIEAFQNRAMCLVDQYSQYHVHEVSMQIDGIRTQGENIADNGGIKQAFKAYEDWLKRNGDGNSNGITESLPGLNASPRQLFFLNFAQVWCGALRPEAIRNKLKTSIHSLGKFRVIGALSNSEDFASAFSCPVGSPMNPPLKCSVW